MKNLKIVYLLLLGLIITFASCEENDDTDTTSECPELSFERDGGELIANFEEINSLDVYEWFVNDELVETENLENQRDNTLDISEYEEGTYSICIKAETPDCPQGVEFCKDIVIGDDMEGCPELKFTKDGEYLFADFEGIDTLEFYAWQVTGENLGNESIIENEGTDNQGDNKFSLSNLEEGIYTICLISESPTCTSAEYCEDITIDDDGNDDDGNDDDGNDDDGNDDDGNDDCPPVSFIEEGTTMFASFSGIDQLDVYEWFVDGVLVETESLQNQDRDDLLDLSTYNPGTYMVCIKAETPDCPNGTEFCMDIVIPEPQQVDCSIFDLEYIESNSAEFVNAHGVITFGVDVSSVVWKIDGNQINPTTSTGHFIILRNHLSQPGTYEVCYTAESSECGTLDKCVQIDFLGL